MFQPTPQQQEIRDAILKVCARFDADYWLEKDRLGGFPADFHEAERCPWSVLERIERLAAEVQA